MANGSGQQEVCERYLYGRDAAQFIKDMRRQRNRTESPLSPGAVEIGELADGWQIAPYDPNELLRCCRHIRLRSGYRLASYQLVSGGNGNGLTLVIPAGQRLPDPIDSDFEMEWDGLTPLLSMSGRSVPEWVRPDVDSFLEGDRSDRSYFEASILLRELRELGAMWHGCDWSTHHLLVHPPSFVGPSWKWLQPAPSDWRPRIARHPDGRIETPFYTSSQHVTHRIVRHQDSYASDSYRVRMAPVTLAEGGPGYVF